MDLTIEQAGRCLTDPVTYTDDAFLHEALTLLRRESPLHRVEEEGFDPFRVVARHADVMRVERENTLFLNEPRSTLSRVDEERYTAENGGNFTMLVHLDGTRHRLVRAIASDWFKPSVLRQLDSQIRRLAKRYVDLMLDSGGSCDFVTELSVHYPLYVIMAMLGLPESDYPLMLTLTQEMFGRADEDKARELGVAALAAPKQDMFEYFAEVTADRRTNPTEDLSSRIANARIDGEYLSDMDTLSYYVLIATAGHDTTSSTLSGGLHALIENPGELARLKKNPDLLPLAVDEMIRWVTPTKSFMRTAAEDCRLGDTVIREGESLLLMYPSANRDEEVFRDPFRFDVGRTGNKHLSFGYGVHRCLGASLAKLEVSAFFAELLPRLRRVELDGIPSLTATTFVGGLKSLPIRFDMLH
ncbi:cytochrome P450 [Streptomyces zhihengii]|uniref:cytochrome P450 n=1 Tax=Streptomyces zhihengii TaxID=1818004 RepID=UPI0033AA3CCE